MEECFFITLFQELLTLFEEACCCSTCDDESICPFVNCVGALEGINCASFKLFMELPIEHFILAVHSLSSYLGMLLEDSLFPLCNVFDELCSNGSCKSEDYHPRRTRSHLVDTVCKDNESVS